MSAPGWGGGMGWDSLLVSAPLPQGCPGILPACARAARADLKEKMCDSISEDYLGFLIVYEFASWV